MKMKQLFQSITTRIIISILLLILPVNLIIIMMTQNYRDAVLEQTLYSCEVILNLYMSQLDKEMYSIDMYSNNLLKDADFILMSEQQGGSRYILAKNSIYTDYTENMLFHYLSVGYFIYAPELEDMTISVSSAKNRKRDKLAACLADTRVLDQYVRWKMIEVDGEKYLLHSFQTGGLYYGGVIFLDDVTNNVLNELDYSFKEVVIDNTVPKAAQNNMIVSVKSQNKGIYLHLTIDKNEIFSKLPLSKRILSVLAYISFILIPALYLILQRTLIRPLRHIDRALRKLENGEKAYRIGKHKYALEFLHINQSFNDMADQIEGLKIENLEQELQQKRMELQNLQLQVRPHFLLNIFNLMFNMAQIKDYLGIQKMAIYLSQYFRYLFRGGKALQKLSSELNVVKAYIEVTEIKNSNCFTVNYDIEEDALDVEIPPLIIHNFIENIMKYALRVDRITHITVRTESTPEWTRIIIEDDGRGIDQKTLECINSGLPVEKDDGEHIGIWNSKYRLKTFCGSEADIEVFSELDRGTKVVIKLPWTGGF